MICNICIDYTATPVALFSSVCKITTALCDTTDILYNMILSPHYHYIHEWMHCTLGKVWLCHLASNIYGCHTIRHMCRLPSEKWHAKLYDEITEILVWYSLCSSGKMACIVWCKCLYKPLSGKMASNAWCKCLWKLQIAIILWRQSPCFKWMWNHQCIATQSSCYCRLFIKPPL